MFEFLIPWFILSQDDDNRKEATTISPNKSLVITDKDLKSVTPKGYTVRSWKDGDEFHARMTHKVHDIFYEVRDSSDLTTKEGMYNFILLAKRGLGIK